MNYEDQLKEEVATWNIDDPVKRQEKIQRETIRHYKLAKDLLLDKLNTQNMYVCEVGGGPISLTETEIDFDHLSVYDPNTEAYEKYWACPHHVSKKIEDVKIGSFFDLVVCTNALDHVESPSKALLRMMDILRPGGFLAIMCAENNALTNPHPCHEHNLTAEWVHQKLDVAFETVWELNYKDDGYRYGWAEYEGKVGQPAFALLMRKVVGYD